MAQFREMEIFTQFSSDLDKSTKELLDHGERLVELLKQPFSKPLRYEQVILLCVANNKLLLDVPIKEIKTFRRDLIVYFVDKYPKYLKKLIRRKLFQRNLSQK